MQNSMIKHVTVADGITICNALFGFTAILFLFIGLFWVSFSLILLGLLADGLDGVVARRRGKGKLGEYLEPMADLTTLSIAPAAFVFVTYQSSVGQYLFLLFGILILFFVSSVVRLGSFHALKDDAFFVGLPASASTIVILVVAFVHFDSILCIALIFILSLLMVSSIRFPKPSLSLNVFATLIIFAAIGLGGLYTGVAPFILLFAVACYIIGGPIVLYLIKKPQYERKN
ncbi:MAG: CDP-alcohol phosphatidyltransferase family protein [Euryarchaeota archaeon]|nr:CDP-alcohol phosphatidyltransferase family protein [Euryarchaeota archaeon]